MKVKKIIIGGCSFTEGDTWARGLQDYVARNAPYITVQNTAMASQGQELIQKKVSLELNKSLKEYKQKEIAVIVMWSGIERKSFYINNPYIILKDQKNFCADNNKYFRDLRNNINKNAAWYICNWESLKAPHLATAIAKTHFELADDKSYAVHLSLENIIFLQNLCKVHNVQLHQMFYMDNVLNDIEQYKDHEIVSYLYEQFDQSCIVDKKSIFTYLKELKNDALYFRSDKHPTTIGQDFWFNQVLFPYLNKKGLLNG